MCVKTLARTLWWVSGPTKVSSCKCWSTRERVSKDVSPFLGSDAYPSSCPNFERLDLFTQCIGILFVDSLLDEYPVGGHTGLSRVSEFGCGTVSPIRGVGSSEMTAGRASGKPLIVASTAISTLASSKTMNGLFPPSSRLSFLTVGEHCSINSLPTRVLPVKLTLWTNGLVQISLPTSATVVKLGMIWTTPGGMPASKARMAMPPAERGVSPAGFQMVVHPAAMAAPAFRVIMAMG